jgi:anti-sigma B factor antagonist
MSLSHLPFQSAVPGSAPPDTKAPSIRFGCIRGAEGGGSIGLILAGELDLAGSTDFRTALDGAQQDSDRVLLDLRALTLIDCAGLAVLFAAGRRARLERASLILMGPRGQVRRLLGLVGAPSEATVLDDDGLPDAAAAVAA